MFRKIGLVAVAVATLTLATTSPVGAVAGYGDVEVGADYATALQWAVNNNISGIDGNCFEPDAVVTRGEAANWLWRMESQPPASTTHLFDDVDDSSLAGAISWLAETQITTGTSATMFSPANPVTRAQVAAFLWRLDDRPEPSSQHSYSDVRAPWQQDPVSWSAEREVIVGTSSDLFSPDQVTTRKDLVSYLWRFQGSPEVTVQQSSPTCDTSQPPTDGQPSSSEDDSTPGETNPDGGEPTTATCEGSTVAQNQVSADDQLLSVDPNLRIGKLENGLTYYLRCNESPGGNLTVRLAVNAGSLNEVEAGSGVAHFLEHMLFNGTEKYPRNELTKVLQSLGIQFGADVNAYTSYDETVYELEAQANDPQQVSTVFDVLAQWAHAATIKEEDVENERGVVRDEYRLRVETGEGKVQVAFPRLYSAGTPYEGRLPIGTVDGIANISAQDLRDFYEKWYVPSNMAVIAVGELPLDELEELVTTHFSSIPAGETPEVPNNHSELDRQPRYDIVTSPAQGYSYLSLDLRLPSYDLKTVEGDRQAWIEQIIAIMAGNRLQDAYEQGYLSQTDPTHWQSFVHARGLRYYGTNLRAQDYETALNDFWSMMLTLDKHGFARQDLDRAVKTIVGSLELAVQAEATTQDTTYAARYVAHFLRGSDLSTASERLARVSQLLNELTPAELTERYREILDQSGLLILGVGADPADLPSIKELTAAVDSAEAGELPPLIAEAEQLLEEPTPVAPVSSTELDVLDQAHEWTFPNGAKVMFVPSDIEENQVQLQAVSLGGWSALEPGDRIIAGRLAPRAVAQSGLGELSPAQLSRYLDGAVVSVSPFIGETNQGVTGSASTDDIETMFQLMHLYFTQPRVDDQAFAEVVNVAEIVLSLSQADPSWKAWIKYLQARYEGAYDWFNPVASQAVIDRLNADTILEAFKKSFAGVDDLVVVLAGDTDLETVERLASTYIGTLPSGDTGGFVNRRTPEPMGAVRHEVDLGPDSQATALEVYHEANVDVSVGLEVASDVLQTMLNDRLVNDVREDIGATYSVSVQLTEYFTPNQGIRSQLSASGAPERMDDIEAEAFRILADFANGEVATEVFDAAVRVLDANYRLESNAQLVSILYRRTFASDSDLPTTERRLKALAELELADVIALADTLYGSDQYINIVRILSS